MRAIINHYGPAGIVGTVTLRDFLSGFGPPIKAADDAPPDGKPPTPLTFPTPYRRPVGWPQDTFLPGLYPFLQAPFPRRHGAL